MEIIIVEQKKIVTEDFAIFCNKFQKMKFLQNIMQTKTQV